MDSDKMIKAKGVMRGIRMHHFGKTEEEFHQASDEDKSLGSSAIEAFCHVLYADDFTEDEVADVLKDGGLSFFVDKCKKPDEVSLKRVQKINEVAQNIVNERMI
jgi:uncharacterized protein YyaL (SSP411 family)